MKRLVGCALIAMALSAVGAPAVMGQFFPGQQANPEYQVQQTQIQLERVRAYLAAATSVLAAKQRLYGTPAANQAQQAELVAAEGAVADARANVALAEHELSEEMHAKEMSDRISALQRPVSVELRDSPVRQAAQTLSQASGVAISVEKSVPTDKRLTVVAQDVPLATILDTVARQTGLLIAQEGNGVLLKFSPTLEVNGERAELVYPFEPWSNEWGQNPTMPGFGISPFPSVAPMRLGDPVGFGQPGGFGNGGFGQGGLGGTGLGPGGLGGGGGGGFFSPTLGTTPQAAPGGGPPMPTAPDGMNMLGAPRPGTPAPGYGRPGARPATGPTPVYGGFGGGGLGPASDFAPSGPPPVMMTALSSTTFVVASPAAAPNEEPAVMLTVYRLEGTTLRKVSSALHRLGSSSGRRGPVGFGQPGGLGNGGFGQGGLGGTGLGPGGFGGGGGGFFTPTPGATPQAAPGYFPANPFAAPPGSLTPRAAPAPNVPGSLDRLPAPHGSAAPNAAPGAPAGDHGEPRR